MKIEPPKSKGGGGFKREVFEDHRKVFLAPKGCWEARLRTERN